MNQSTNASALEQWAVVASNLRRQHVCPSTIEQWARLSRLLQHGENRDLRPSTIATMARCGERFAIERLDTLHAMIDHSNRRLTPIGDPLAVTFGLNRWLSGDREEAYSDWLAWILGEVGAKHVAYLLGVPMLSGDNGSCLVGREESVPVGHKGHAGRLDCVVRFKDTIIALELKIGEASDADRAKQEGYISWLQAQTEAGKYALFVALNPPPDAFGFAPLPWETLTKRMRHVLKSLVEDQHLLLACIVAAFVGAIEQNILGFPAIQPKTHWSVAEPAIDRLIPYLAEENAEEKNE